MSNRLINAMDRLNAVYGTDACWDECVSIARGFGAKAVNVGHFTKGAFLPTWGRVSQEAAGKEEYFARGLLQHDPILALRNRRHIGDWHHVNANDAATFVGLRPIENEALQLNSRNGFSDLLVTQHQLHSGKTDALVVFASDAEGQQALDSHQRAELGILAGLILSAASPPTPNDTSGLIPGLYGFLSVREQDVLKYLASGLQNAEIAFRLGISEITVQLHTKNAKRKMQARTREQAVALALTRGLISL